MYKPPEMSLSILFTLSGGYEMSTNELLDYKKAGMLVGYSPGTLRNLVCRGEFQKNVHYFKPRGKVQFLRSALIAWMKGQHPAACSNSNDTVDT